MLGRSHLAANATSCLKAAHLCKGHLTQPLRTGRGRLICIAAMAKGSQSKRVVLWFRDDLRLRDNYIVASAAKMVKAGQASEVLPLYCFDPRSFGTTPFGNPKTGSLRAKFLLDSVQDLKANLRKVGSDLLIHMGRPEEAMAEYVPEGGECVVLAQEQITGEELDVDAKVCRALKDRGHLDQVWGHTMYHRDDLPFDPKTMKDTFTPVKQQIESKCTVRKEAPTPQKGDLPLPAGLEQKLQFQPNTVEDLNVVVPEGAAQLSTPQYDQNSVLQWKGGETEALARLHYYFWESKLLSNYKQTRNGMLGGDYSTKFSAWLAHGNISPRTIYHEIQRYEKEHGSNQSTYWVIFELTWRDYFRFFTIKYGDKIFFEYGTTGKKVEWNSNKELFKRWREGTTGLPLVDANMRELARSGFMSNRGRQNVASYLVLDLGIDWRHGADWFESVLVDYDVCSNWGNWVAAAGMTGGRINHFNIIKQSRDYDENGDYVKTWLPELKNVPATRIFEPAGMSKHEQEQSGVHIGQDYPAPIPRSQCVQIHKDSGPGRSGGRGRGRGGGHGSGRGTSNSKFRRHH